MKHILISLGAVLGLTFLVLAALTLVVLVYGLLGAALGPNAELTGACTAPPKSTGASGRPVE